MNERHAMVAAGAALSSAGLSPGTTGNLSTRLPDGLLCTPTNASLGALDPDGLSTLSMDGSHLHGPRPTKESFFHAAVYAADASCGAVVHLHSTWATAVACLRDLDPDDAIPALTPYLTMRAGPVAVVDYVAPGSSQLAAPIAERVRGGFRAMLLRNHGLLAVGRTLDEAVAIAVELEESAKLQLILSGMTTRGLSVEERAALRT